MRMYNKRSMVVVDRCVCGSDCGKNGHYLAPVRRHWSFLFISSHGKLVYKRLFWYGCVIGSMVRNCTAFLSVFVNVY